MIRSEQTSETFEYFLSIFSIFIANLSNISQDHVTSFANRTRMSPFEQNNESIRWIGTKCWMLQWSHVIQPQLLYLGPIDTHYLQIKRARFRYRLSELTSTLRIPGGQFPFQITLGPACFITWLMEIDWLQWNILNFQILAVHAEFFKKLMSLPNQADNTFSNTHQRLSCLRIGLPCARLWAQLSRNITQDSGS